MANVPVIVAAILTGIGLLLAIVASATPAWRYKKVEVGSSSQSQSVGLFKTCLNIDTPGFKSDECTSFSATTGWLKASQAFMILSILVTVACLICIILRLVVKNLSESKALEVVCMLLAYVAMICALISYAVFAGKTSDSALDIGYSFGLAAAASALLLGAAIALTCNFCSS